VPDQEAKTYRQYLEVVFKVYWKDGFEIKDVCPDQEFEGVLRYMAHEFKFIQNTTSAKEHVLVIKRSIRVV
jgi:hypothetical protein